MSNLFLRAVVELLNCCYNFRMRIAHRFLSKVWSGGLLWVLMACAVLPSPLPPTGSPSPTASLPTSTTVPLPPTATTTPLPTPVPTATPRPGMRLEPELVRVYPRPAASGDRLSFDIEPVLLEGYDAPFTVTLTLPDGRLFSSPVVPVGFDRQPRARFIWVWDTTGLTGTLPVTVTLLAPPDIPDAVAEDNVLPLTVSLLAPEALPPPEPEARWASQVAGDIRLFYLTGSAAERDLVTLLALAQRAYTDVAARFDAVITRTLDIYVMDRIVGQGGYATSDWVAISYADRAYAPAEMLLLLRHELTHRLDGAWKCDNLPPLLREGLAVLVAGGHYWPESLPRKAAALLQTDAVVPLKVLLEDFYRQQHEIGYLQGGALVAYLVEERGWEGMRTVCETTATAQGDSAERFAAALRAVNLPPVPQLEQEWHRWLRALPVTAEEVRRLQSEWWLMDTMRVYQRQYDPSANFLTGILFDPAAGVQRGIAADFVRRPRDPAALALELLLQRAQEALRAFDLTQAETLLGEINAALVTDPTLVPEVAQLLTLVEAVLARGYEPYRTVCVADATAIGQRAPGCLVYGLDLAAWPTQRILWATRQTVSDTWTVVGPQAP